MNKRQELTHTQTERSPSFIQKPKQHVSIFSDWNKLVHSEWVPAEVMYGIFSKRGSKYIVVLRAPNYHRTFTVIPHGDQETIVSGVCKAHDVVSVVGEDLKRRKHYGLFHNELDQKRTISDWFKNGSTNTEICHGPSGRPKYTPLGFERRTLSNLGFLDD